MKIGTCLSRKALLIFLIAPLTLLCWIPVQAQDNVLSYSNPKRYIIKDITVSGVQYLDPSTLISLSGLQKGDTIELPSPEATNAVKKLLSQNLFSDVSLGITHQEGNFVTLNLNLVEQPRIASIDYAGVKRSAQDDLKEKLTIRPGQQATPTTLDAAVRTIRKYYLEKGYLHAKIEVRQQPDTLNKNAVKITFVVDRGKKVLVKSINFVGNDSFKASKLRWKALKKTKVKNWNFFRSAKYVEALYSKDLTHLIEYYNQKGYRDARIIKDSVYPIGKKRVGIDIELEEGPLYHIRDIKWVGNSHYSSELLSKMLGLKKGDIYDQALIDKQLYDNDRSITTSYMDNGYLFFNITPVETEVNNDSVTLEMRITEGPQATISEVKIFGNSRTNERVIRRELRTYPGDLFSKTNIMRSLRELANLGFFNPETFNIKPIPNPQDGTVVLEYTVEEKQSDQLELSAGWGNGMFIGSLGVRLTNFSAQNLFKKKAWSPIPSGDGQSLSIKATTNGKQYQQYNISFTDPWLGGYKPINFQVGYYYSLYDYSEYLWSPSDDFFRVHGASVGLGTRLKWPDDFFTIYGEISYQNYLLRNWRQDFIFTDGTVNNLAFKIVWGRNSVDQLIYPRSGSNFSISVQFTPPYSLLNGKDYTSKSMTNQERFRWIEYHKWVAKAQWYTRLVGDLVLYFGVQVGYLGYYNKSVGYSPFEGFDLGGDGMTGYNFIYGREPVGLRGYSNNSLTPIMASGVRMANIYNKLTLELRYPIMLKPQSSIYMLLFTEAGNAWYEYNKINPFRLFRSAGAGIRVFLPMIGMLGFDIGYGFDPVPGNPKANAWQPHFVIGMPF